MNHNWQFQDILFPKYNMLFQRNRGDFIRISIMFCNSVIVGKSYSHDVIYEISSWLKMWFLSFTTNIFQHNGSLNRENIVDTSLKFVVICFHLQYSHYNIVPLILPTKKSSKWIQDITSKTCLRFALASRLCWLPSQYTLSTFPYYRILMVPGIAKFPARYFIPSFLCSSVGPHA